MKLSEKYLRKNLHPVTRTMHERKVEMYGVICALESIANIFKDDIKANAELDKIAKEENL